MAALDAQSRRSRVVEGNSLQANIPELVRAPIRVPAKEGVIYLSDEGVLDGHVLLLGGIGQGKTNVAYHFLSSVQSTMGEDDVAVIFDPKGDYLRFRRPNDIVVNDPNGKDEEQWNLLAELLPATNLERCGDELENREETIAEVSHTLFDESREKTQQIFFPTAAMQLFAASLSQHRELLGEPPFTNESLFNYWNRKSVKEIVDGINNIPEMKGLCNYLTPPNSTMAMGVLSEVVQVIRDVFLGRFRNPGTFSIREAIRKRGARCIFIEYRIRAGKTQSALYRIMIDLAIKEALSSRIPASSDEEQGRVYFFLDEFRLLPRLAHLDNGVNFGREFGLRFIAGMQSHSQVKTAYGDEADSILSGFNTIFAFRTTTPDTRAFVQGIAGRNKKLHVHSVIPGQPLQQIIDAQVIEDWDVWNLEKGRCIVFLPNREPFIANIELHHKKRAP